MVCAIMQATIKCLNHPQNSNVVNARHFALP